MRLDPAPSERTFWFDGVLFDRNPFSGFAGQASAASGIGTVFVRSRVDRFTAELAAVDDAVLHGDAQLRYRLSHDAQLRNTFRVESGSSDTLSTNNFPLQMQMRKSRALFGRRRGDHNTNPPPGKLCHTDTAMTANLVYDLHTAKISVPSPPPALLQGLKLP